MSILSGIAQSYQERTPPPVGSPVLGAALQGSRYTGAGLLLAAAEQEPDSLSIIRSQDAYAGLLSSLREIQLEDNRRETLRGAWVQLEKIRTEQIEPAPGWEQTAAYLTVIGQPFKLDLSDTGQVEVKAQIESDLTEYTPQQRTVLFEALDTLEKLNDRQDERERAQEIRANLLFASFSIDRLKDSYPPSEPWEFDFVNLRALGKPVQVTVDDDGEIVAIDQTAYPHNLFEDVEDLVSRQKLQNAVQRFAEVSADPNKAREIWEYELVGSIGSNDDVYIALNDEGEIELRRNNILSIIPEKYKTVPEVETSAPWQDEALRYSAEPYVNSDTNQKIFRQPFYLDFDATGQNVVVKKNDLVNVSGLNDVNIGELGVENALVNLLA